MRASPTTRHWTALLVLACMLPMVLAMSVLIYFAYVRERALAETAAIHIARALMQTVEREISIDQGTARALATSYDLTSGDLRAFHGQALKLIAHLPSHNLIVTDRFGQQLANTAFPFGDALPMHGNAKQIREVAHSGQARVSDLYEGAALHRLVTSVDVPVVRDGKVIYVLSMQLFPERLGKILVEQHIPEGWVAAIVDSADIVVARTREQERFIGKPATPGISRAMSRMAEGSIEDRTLEGIPSVAVFSRSPVSNWAVVIGMHKEVLTAPLRKTISWLIAGSVLMLALGLGVAKLIAGRMAKAIWNLVGPAMALGHGDEVVVPHLPLHEANEVGQAMMQAAQLLHRRTEERDLAERAEREAREAKRQLEQSEAFLRGVFEETPDPVFLVASNGKIMRTNAEAEHLFGYLQDHFLAMDLDALLVDPRPGQEHALRNALFALEGRHMIDGQTQLQGCRADGSVFPAEVAVSPLHAQLGDMAIVSVRDVTERVRAAEALGMLNKRLALATRAGRIAVWEWDLVTGELWWDERMHELYKVPPEQASRKYDMWRERVHPDDLGRAERDRDDALEGRREYDTEFRIVLPDGDTRWICANAIVSRDASGKPVRMTGANIDISENRQKEIAIQEALRDKETLLKELYHRVKNNLQVISSMFSLQMQSMPEGEARTALADGAGRVRAMALVHEKLYQAGNLSSISLPSYISDLCVQLGRAASAAERGIRLTAEVAPLEIGLETAVPLGLILNELIANSLQHAFPPGRSGNITVRVALDPDGRTRLSVNDDGVGFPSGFDPTFAHSLGLKLVTALSRQLGGELSLRGGQGTCVDVVFRPQEVANLAPPGRQEK